MLHKRLLPPLGQRIIKTAFAVFLVLVFYRLQGFHGSVSSAAVTAIICMQPYVSDSRTFALERILGTVLGALWGLVYLQTLQWFPARTPAVTDGILCLFLVLSMYSTVVMKKTSIAAQAAIVFLGTVISGPEAAAPLAQTLERLADTIVGTIIAIAVNVAHLPRVKHPEYLFFVRTMDLVPDRYARIPSSVHIALEHLYRDGAKICLVSRWAPAFIVSQMGLITGSTPMIIMDGAALYDVEENRYLDVFPIPQENADRLRGILAGFGVGCNIYTVNERTLSIYRDGPENEAERREFETMKRSPYRHYVDGLYREEDYITFLRVIDTKERIAQLEYEIASVLPLGMFRTEVREEARFPEYSSLYFYDPKATQANMKKRLQEILEQKEGPLEAVDLMPRISKYLPEHDALILLSRLKNLYEPVFFLPHRKKK